MFAKTSGSAFSRPVLAAITAALVAMLMFGSPCAAQPSAGEGQGAIPVGTVITLNNWQKYRQFMSAGMQAEFEGVTVVKLPQQLKMVVGPSRPVPEPQKFLADTEKYQHLVTLKELPSGGFVPENYVAGYPFPNPPTGPNRGIKVLYNMYYNYKPYLMERSPVWTYATDKYGSISTTTSEQIITRMRHISDVGMPHTLPGAPPDVFFTQYQQQFTPEESKYFSILGVFPTDPSKDENIYTYLPALRRSLRSSSASRCAPLLGGDLFYDDINGGFNGIPSEWYVKFDGERPLLNILHQNEAYAPESDFFTTHLWWPKPSVGNWELEKVYVLDAKPIPSVQPGYCYSKKVLYVDANQNQVVAVDYYDPRGKLWKDELEFQYPTPIPGVPGEVTYNSFLNLSIVTTDLQETHVTSTGFEGVNMNSEVPKKFHNISRYASPSGLDQIMQ